MSAQPAHQLPIKEQQSPEVISLVVPQTANAHAPTYEPYSMLERLSLAFYNYKLNSKAKSDRAHALAFALSFTLVAGYWAYNVKSAFGVDIFPHQHLENFVPLPGWQR